MFIISIKKNVLHIDEINDHFDGENVILPLSIADFEKVSINGGSYGKVYKLKYQNEPYILKIFNDKRHRDICLQEFSFLAEIPYFGDVKNFDIEGKPALLMKEVSGLCLSDDTFKSLSILEKLEVWKAILKVASLLTKLNIVHLDLKSEHIFYNFENKEAYIIDFGSAKRNGEPFKDINTTFTYAPPEFFSENNNLVVDSKMDSYSLGIIAYELFGSVSTQEVLEVAYSGCKNQVQFQYALTTKHHTFSATLRKTVELVLSNNSTYHDEINGLFEKIDLTQSEIIAARPTTEVLFNVADEIFKEIQLKQYQILKRQLINTKIDASSQANYDALWRNTDSYAANIYKLFNDYLNRGKSYLTNRRHTSEVRELLNSRSKYFPLILIEKIYNTISSKENFNPNGNGSVLKRLAYITKKLSPCFENSPISSSVMNNGNIEQQSPSYMKHGDNSLILLSKPPTKPKLQQQNINRPSFT